MKSLLFCFLLFTLWYVSAQDKELNVQEVNDKIKIDGVFDEPIWQNAEVATSFVEFRPNNGNEEKTNSGTKVRVTYDNNAIYFAVNCFESKIDSLNTRLSNRDEVGDDMDWFIIQLNPFNDQQQYFQFGISAAGVQFDSFATLSSGEDWNWNAIWNSAVIVTEKGYDIEVAIPYSAIRFPKGQTTEWSVNFIRNYNKNRKLFSWVRVDNEKGNMFQYNGKIKGLNNIHPPTRLFFIPYISDYLTVVDGETQNSLKGGMDLNWGINESYVLDAVLIPDFGQTAFDNVQYVLGPFEQQFSDRRPFFTEGMDMFRKGDLIYTRRVGQAPSYYPDLEDNEEIESYPSETQLINALKVSGRGEKGLGVGVLNAIMDKAEAVIYNTETQQNRKAIVSPYTNYNEIVLDKRFQKSASSLSLVNTSTIRNGSFRDANVTALVADLYDEENKYNVFAEGKYSFIHDTQNKTGYNIGGSLNKQFGINRYGLGGSYVSKDYDINDMGINFYTNYWGIYAFLNNRILESNDIYNTKFINSNVNARFDLETGKPYYINGNFNFNSTNKKNNYNGFGISFAPIITYSFYEPRVEGRYSQRPASFSIWYYNSPNYSKKFLIDKNLSFGWESFKNQYNYSISLSPRYRPSNKLLLSLNWYYNYSALDRGWVNQIGEDIIYGARNRKTNEFYIQGDYYFNPYTSLSLNFRHYYTNAEYQEFYTLNQDGSYKRDRSYNQNHNFTFNTWNMDLKFSWWFAPGSQMEILYRNTFDSYNDIAENNWGNNFDFLFDQPITQILSFRVTYFLDYNKAKNFVRRKKSSNADRQQQYINSLMERNKQRNQAQRTNELDLPYTQRLF